MDESRHSGLGEVFRCVGCAILSAQFMEKELACLLLMPRMTEVGRSPSEEEIQESMDKCNRMTFGQLIRQLEAIGDIGELSGKLQIALDKRNHLAHHFFETYRNDLNDSDVHEIMKKELSGMKELFDKMFDGFHHVNFRLMRDLGICTETGELTPEE